MPKNNIGNKRASSASTKKSSLKRRFDLTNRKVQFFVVIAIVAVLGGGWFTYRSFAAEATLYTFTPQNGALECLLRDYCKQFQDTSKNNMNVFQIYGAPDGSPSEITTTRMYLIAGTTYNVCVSAKGQQRLSITDSYNHGPSYWRKEINVNDLNAYKNYCVPYVAKYSSDTGFGVTNRDVNGKVIPMFGVLISQMYITRSTPTPTAPAPPAK